MIRRVLYQLMCAPSLNIWIPLRINSEIGLTFGEMEVSLFIFSCRISFILRWQQINNNDDKFVGDTECSWLVSYWTFVRSLLLYLTSKCWYFPTSLGAFWLYDCTGKSFTRVERSNWSASRRDQVDYHWSQYGWSTRAACSCILQVSSVHFRRLEACHYINVRADCDSPKILFIWPRFLSAPSLSYTLLVLYVPHFSHLSPILVTFGSPAIGNTEFCGFVHRRVSPSGGIRVFNDRDVVTYIAQLVGYTHAGKHLNSPLYINCHIYSCEIARHHLFWWEILTI